MGAGAENKADRPVLVAGLSADRQVELTRLVMQNGAGPREHQRKIEHVLRQGGPESNFVQNLLQHEQRRKGESPHDKALVAPQTK